MVGKGFSMLLSGICSDEEVDYRYAQGDMDAVLLGQSHLDERG